MLSDNGSQFSFKFLRSVGQVMGIENAFTSTYHSQTIEQTNKYNRTILKMLHCYTRNNQDWYEYLQALTYARKTGTHSSTEVAHFDLVHSRPPVDPAITRYVEGNTRIKWTSKQDWVLKMV